MEHNGLSSKGCRPENGVCDMIVISDIDENGINTNLKTRYQKDEIYTFTGTILVSVNPYKTLPIYEEENVAQYSGKKLNQGEPHIFGITEAAYQNLQNDAINQSCIISGESGAGKTESTKFILQYLCSVTNHVSIWVEQQILEANTILEAFGNAKTVRNDNSSRFGKFMQVCFDDVSQIKGCIVQDYLLEQSRITFQSSEERNYHVFYQLVAGAKNIPELRDQFFIGPAESYDYLNQSGCFSLDGIDDAQMFDNLRLAMNVLNIPAEMMDGIFAVLSSILLLGNMKFEDDDGERCHLTDADSEIGNTICCLLGLDFERFTEVCLYRQIQVRGTVTSIPYKVNEAIENKHAMAKALYSRTFAWLVDSINKCTNPGQHQTKFIGVLDIFGFENFHTNSFEQLCINYTNEKLHRFFNHYVFALEQQIYKEEGISFSHINFTDNTLCLELIEKPPKCILKILDEECRFPQGTDKSYIAKQHQSVEDHSYYVKGDRRLWETEFGIQHYAGLVTYKVEGFLNKNKDTQQDQLFDLMFNSNNAFVKDLTRFQDLLGVRLEDLGGRSTISRTSRGKPTVADTFKHQLSALVDVLGTTNPWYVRCLKPNVNKLPNNYKDDDVLTQLRYSGMLDIIRIKKEGYPIHVDIGVFMEKFRCLIDINSHLTEPDECKQAVKALMDSLNLPMTEWQIGRTKVFLRNSVFEPLEERRQVILTKAAVVIQKVWLGYRQRKAFLRLRHATIVLQSNFRVMRDRIAFLRKKRAAIVLQAYARGMLARQLAHAERALKKAEEERLRQEEMERERLRKEKEEADELALEDSLKESQAVLESLTKTIESMWEVHHIDVTPSSLDLDEMFNFLDTMDSKPEENVPLPTSPRDLQKEQALQEINDEFDDLDELIENSSRFLTEMSATESTENDGEGESGVGFGFPPPPPSPPPPGLSAPPPPAPPVPCESSPVPMVPPAPPVLSGSTAIPCAPPLLTDVSATPVNRTDSINSMDLPPLPPSESQFEENGTQEDGLPPPPPPPVEPPMAPPVPMELKVSGETVVIPPPPSHAPPLPPSQPPQSLPLTSILNNGMIAEDLSETCECSPPSPIAPHDSPSSQTPHPLIPHVVSADPSHTVITQPPVPPGNSEVAKSRRPESVNSSLAARPVSTAMEIEPCHMLEYAEENFNEHVRGYTGSVMKSLKRKTTDVLKKEEMLQYNKSGAIPTSHIRLHDIENIQLACNIFKELTKYIREEQRPEAMIQTVQYIVKSGIERIELRDEIFCQLIRQTNQVPETDSLLRAWCLFCHCTAAFTPSKGLNKYLSYYIFKHGEMEGVGDYAKQCLRQLRTPKVMTRKCPPSSIEISALQTGTPIVTRVYFMDGKTKAVSVLPCDTMSDVLEKVAIKIGLKSVEGWAIYEVTPDYERFIRSYEYLADILSQWEQQHRAFNTLSKYDTISRKSGKSLASGARTEEARFVFRKRVYRHVHDIPNDPVEYHLLFSEAVHKVVVTDEFSVSEKVALQLAGLQARVVLGSYEDGKDARYTDVNQYLCKRILSISGRNWPKEIMEAHKNYTSGKTEVEAKVWYLTCVKQFPLYGCTFFPITHKGMWGHKGSTLLAVNMDGVKFIKAKDKSVIHDFKYCDIETFAVDPNENYISFELKNDSYSRCPQRSFIFETSQKEDIGFLTASYSSSHTSWLKTDPDNMKKMKMSDDDKLRVYSELVSCRAALVESQVLQKPAQESSGMGLLRNTLRKLTKSSGKMERLRRYSLGNMDGVFNLAYWSYNKSPIHQTFLVFSDSQEEETAVRMYNSMLDLEGPGESGTIEMANQMSGAQKIIQRCMESAQLCNEFYLQVIKQTSDNPEPDSRINQWYWQLLSLATSSMVPSNPLILSYLQTHLKKCSMDTKTEEGKYARFCHKCLNRNMSQKQRKFPPSSMEIQYIFQRRYIKEKVYFVNGELRIIEFDSAATAEEVVKIIKTKLGMRSDADGFALYEVMGSIEKTMGPDERMSDTISKWDRWAKGNYSTKELRILFKKRLFIVPYLNINDPVECELVFHQLIEDVFEKRIPITESDAVQMCALKFQSEMDDCPLDEIDYSSVMRILPREIRPCLNLEDIAAAHREICHFSPQEAILAFIDVLKSWLFFGSTVFEVTQGYTTAMPKNLLLLINEAGLHVVHPKLSRVYGSYNNADITCTSPSLQSIMIIIGQVAKGTKYVFNTTQAAEISSLIKDYRVELKRRRAANLVVG